MIKKYISWEEVGTTWNTWDDTWDDVSILIEIERKRGGSSYADYIKGNPWDKNKNIWDKLKTDIGEEKTNKVIKLYCKVNNIDYTKVVESKKDIKVTADKFENFVKETIKESVSIKVNL